MRWLRVAPRLGNQNARSCYCLGYPSNVITHGFSVTRSSFSVASNFFSLAAQLLLFGALAPSPTAAVWKTSQLEDESKIKKKTPRGPKPDSLLGCWILCLSIGQPRPSTIVETPLDQVSAPLLSGCYWERLARYSSFFCDIEAYKNVVSELVVVSNLVAIIGMHNTQASTSGKCESFARHSSTR